MKILIEEYEYDVEVLKQYVDNPQVLFPTNNKESGEKRSTDEVGYYFNNRINDCVFILPKVVLQGKEEGIEESKQDESTASSDDNANNTSQKVFGKYDPEKIIDLDKSGIDTQIMAFIRQFSVWIYRAVNVYRLRDLEQRKSVKSKFISKVNNYEDELEGTILDPILALIDFYDQNRHFLMFSLKDIHRGFNKIHWAKTIGRQTPVKQSDGSMFYMHPINRKKQVDYDEDLYVVFFSILNYLKKRMGFPIHLDLNLELLPLSVIEHYRSGYGKIYLRQIKYRYFADKELKLWKLCYAFFESSSNISTHEFAEEYLIVNKFEHVFEDIIDSLLRDSNVPKRNKEQRDGKIVDHIYKYQSLVNDEPLYYIGDSKYYKMGHEVRGTQSEYKQYTYAKNVIQYNLELFLKKSGIDHLQYRDKLTEGYNITPNFFISGQINPENLSYDVSGLVPHMFKVGNKETNTTKQEQFENRLFDRDTLWLSHYDINFLYVISLYVRNNDLANRTFSENAKRTFREKIIEAIGSYYDFYVLTPKKDNYRSFEATVRQLFWLLNGKIYRPDKDKELLVLAILKETSDQERTELFGNVDLYFDKKEGYQLGSDMATFINESEPIAQNNH